MGAVSFSIDPVLIQCLKTALPLETFVETGTFEGDSAIRAAGFFASIHTVELSEHYFQRAADRLKSYPSVHCYHGPSPEILRTLQPRLTGQSVLYWLDAHWCDPKGTAGVDAPCPLLAELDGIGQLNDQSVVLIDDARLFLAPPPRAHAGQDWPDGLRVFQKLASLNPNHRVRVINDVILCYPDAIEDIVQQHDAAHGIDWIWTLKAARQFAHEKSQQENARLHELAMQQRTLATKTRSWIGQKVRWAGRPLGLFQKPKVIPPSTVFHITHWKAGSQWLYAILNACAGDDIVRPRADMSQVLQEAVLPGKIYPTLYLSKGEFDLISLPPESHAFVVIRDLRDTMISLYFSLKKSHPEIIPAITRHRQVLSGLDQEEGLLYTLATRDFAQKIAEIQMSWLGTDVPLIRYEDLLSDDEAILERVLIDECRLPVSRERLRTIVRDYRFERLTEGRPRGQENPDSHQRKGIAGDWRNYFTPRVAAEMQARYGAVLIATGYEKGPRWAAA